MIGSLYWTCSMCSSSSIASICVWTLSGSSGIVSIVKAIKCNIELCRSNIKGTGNELGVLCIENIMFSNAGLVGGSDCVLDGSGNVWVLNELIIVFETSWSIA